MSNRDLLKKIKILYEDANIAAVNKPAGLMVHPDGRANGPFLTDWIVEKFPRAVNVGEPARGRDGNDLNRSGIAHRLDTETSGVILIAKTKKGFECLKKQFQDRTVKKKYIAFVWGEMKEEFGTINKPIGRSKNDFRKWSAEREARGEMREAKTYWEKVESGKLQVESGEEKFTLVKVEPKTGRTHQIRVHFAAIQHPVAGDRLYAPNRPFALGFERMALHSQAIEFENCAGEKIKVEAPLPEDFEKANNLLFHPISF